MSLKQLRQDTQTIREVARWAAKELAFAAKADASIEYRGHFLYFSTLMVIERPSRELSYFLRANPRVLSLYRGELVENEPQELVLTYDAGSDLDAEGTKRVILAAVENTS